MTMIPARRPTERFICRSPAAEYIMKKLTNKYIVLSKATSYEEIGNDIYPPMKRELMRNHIPFDRHYAKRIDYKDYEKADYIFYMDYENQYSLNRQIDDYKSILFPINKWTNSITEIEDPWYTGRYQLVCDEITECIKDIFKHI